MEAIQTPLKGLLRLVPKVFSDPRGHFFESYNLDKFKELGMDYTFVQDNQSLSNAGVLRGLHFQKPPYAQGKLVRVVKGAVLDVAVDIRKGSPTYGQHYKAELSEENFEMLFIPPGFAHGFLTLRDHTVFQYKCTNMYNQASEGSVRWDDPSIAIQWNVDQPVLSDKDKIAPLFQDFDSPFIYE